ncbi:MAG: MFS transporter [Thermoplasmata archaeon]
MGGSSPPPAPAAPSFARALGHRPFLLLWSSQLISQSGDFVFEVALLWLVLQQTGSAFYVGVVVAATLVPVVVLGPFLGVYVDRWPRRTILILTNGLEAVLVAGLSGLILAHAANIGGIVAIVVALATGGQVVRITSTAIVPQTVRTEDLAPANSLLSFSSSFNQVVGLSIGGVVVALFGVTIPIEYDALTFAAAAVILGFMSRTVGAPAPSTPGVASGFAAEFAEGFRYVAGQRYLVEIIVLASVINFFGNAVAALFAPYADYVLHGGSTAYGFLGAAVAGGAIVGAVVIGKVNTRGSAGKYLLGGTGAAGAVILAVGLTRSTSLALGEMVALGAMLSVTNIPIFVLLQAKVPGRLMGRVLGVLMAMVLAAAPLGAFFAGTFAEATSVGFVYVVAGAVLLATVAVGAVVMRELRTVTY